MNFLADMDHILFQNKNADIYNNLNRNATWHVKLVKLQRSDRALTRTAAYLKKNDMKAIPFDKGIVYCIMTEDDYLKRCERVLIQPQFVKSNISLSGTTRKSCTIKDEEKFNNRLKELRTKGSKGEEFNNKVSSTGAQRAGFYGIAKAHKRNTPLRLVLFLPGSCYETLTIALAKWLKKLPEAQIKTYSIKIKVELVSTNLEDDEMPISLDVKSLYTNRPVEESRIIAADCVYARDTTLDFSKETFIELMSPAFRKADMLCGET